MLFVNFLCLLYLMLLVNGHTLSKNIDNFYSDERVDSLHDFEYTPRPKSKYDKYLHKHRRFKPAFAATTSKATGGDTRNEFKTTKTTSKRHHIKVHKSTRKRLGGFWRKYKPKENKILQRDKRVKYRLGNEKYTYKTPPFGSRGRVRKFVTKPMKSIYALSFEKKKRDLTKVIKKRLNRQKELKGQKNIQVNITPYENLGNILKVTTLYKDPTNFTDLNKFLTTMGTKVAELKNMYGLDKSTLTYSVQKHVYTPKRTSTFTTTTELDIIATAQIEDLLNDIKEKAVNMIAEQNPGVTELITNTVTETTFQADPILNNLDIHNPYYSLNTFTTLNNDYAKRDADFDKNTKYRKERSIKEDAMTAAQNIEDLLQKEMKNIYKKVKNKVSGDYRKEVEKVKTTVKNKTKKICSKVNPTKVPHTPKHVSNTSKVTTSTKHLSHNRIDRKSDKHTKVTKQEITTTPGIDDYSLLTLYEQMLAKTCQNNIMNMATSREILVRSKRNKQLVSNRNFETLFDKKLKDENKFYEDREEIPDDLEYNFELNIPEISTAKAMTEMEFSNVTGNDEEISDNINKDISKVIPPEEENSFDSLTSKISYEEFVNGYRHYLNFQKEQAHQNFSNLVRYQAHRHHNVDDIGKYILNKIPQIPSRDKRYLENKNNHDTTTKSGQSWFKKHFYIFIENGTPKKYHTSQTVSLKSPSPAVYDKSLHRIEYLEIPEFDDILKRSSEAETSGVDINLDQLCQVLEIHKSSHTDLPVEDIVRKDLGSQTMSKHHRHIFKSRPPHHIIDKVFGKDRKVSHKAYGRSNIANDLNYRSFATKKGYENGQFKSTNGIDRIKRNPKSRKVKTTTIDETNKFQTKMSAKLNHFTKTKKKPINGKQGCVDIDLVVPPPTALVKLKEAKHKETKLKKLLRKLHLSRSSEKKVKREYANLEYTRKQRLNPIQILKNIFKSTTKGKTLKEDDNVPDYEMLKSRIDTFKPIKFQKVLNMDEMRQQVPNITDEHMVSLDPDFVAKNDASWNLHTAEKGFTDFTDSDDTPTTVEPVIISSTFLPQLVQGRVRYPIIKTSESKTTQNINGFITTEVETKSSYKPKEKNVKFPQHMALKDIKDQVDDMIIKITSEHNFKKSSTEGITNYKMLNDKKTGDRDIANGVINYGVINIPKNKICLPASKIRPKSENRTIFDSNQKSELVENNSMLKEPRREFKIMDETTQTPITIPIPTINLFTLGMSIHENEMDKYKQFPDYFSDLLMWHKDILYSDKVPSPWRDILKNMNHEPEYISPDIVDLQQELLKINDALNIYNFKPKDLNVNTITESPTSPLRNKGITRNEFNSMILERPPTIKRLHIKEEREHINIDPRIVNRNLKATGFAKGINKVAKNLTHEAKYKLNELQDATESYTDNKDQKYQSVILVDTTLLSYDDDVNYVSTLTPRELSKHKQKIGSLDKSVLSHKAKSNKQPAQYFATPLPMKTTDFEHFLKAHKIDVESVTTPIIGIPGISAYSPKRGPKTKTTMINTAMPNITTKTKTKLKQKANKSKTKPKQLPMTKTKYLINEDRHEEEFGNQFDYLDILEKDLFRDYNYEKKDRFRRHRDLNWDKLFLNYNTFNNLKTNKNKANTIKNKQKMLYKKPVGSKVMDFKNPGGKDDDLTKPNDFDITIINFGDINKLTDQYVPIDTITTNKKVSEVTDSILNDGEETHLGVESIEKDSKDSQFLHKLHNDFFYDHAYTMNKETNAVTRKPININEMELFTPTFDLNEAIMKKMPIKPKHHPKRVRISGQSYKYDIIYHQPENQRSNRDSLSVPYVTSADINTRESLLPSFNRDFVTEGDVARSDVSKTRFVRKVKATHYQTTEKIDTSTITDIEELRKPQQHYRVKRLFPVIQNKFKMFSKSLNTSSYVEPKSSTIILSTALTNSSQGSVTSIDNKNASIFLLDTAANTNEETKYYSNKDTDGTLEIDDKLVNPTLKSIAASVFGSENNSDVLTTCINKLQEYLEIQLKKSMSTTKSRTFNSSKSNSNKDYINKREIQGLETHTAKDVAALEVIVDMMKNTLNYDETNHSIANYYESKSNRHHIPDKVYPFANSIQVHIAVPFEVENSKKRSLEPVKVRKVFSAKLCSPVDIEYQVNSFEAKPTTEKASDSVDGLTPGVYLLVDNAYFPQGVALKPVHPNLSLMNVRQIKPATEKITSTVASKNIAKVTLSKDFISAINKQLLHLYNLTTSDKGQHNVFNEIKKDKIFKRSLNWEAIKKLFGHDRVCHCKCKVNQTICRACAASDIVMSELIFEFDNLSKYMNDHCTEIQTYFWMNPSGGKRLKDSVHKIDQRLRDYYKRVKGKCQGRTCKTFATYLDKREFHKFNKMKKQAGDIFINDLEQLAKDVGRVSRTVTCFKENISEEFDKLKFAINKCIYTPSTSDIYQKSNDKTSELMRRQSKDVKNVYSLDNVNVNIICKTESPVSFTSSSTNQEKNFWSDSLYKEKPPKGFKRLFHCFRKQKKDKILTDFWKQTTKQFAKRAVKENQIESPLISDTGGSFWHDYIKKTSSVPKFPRRIKPKFKNSLFETIRDNVTNAVNHSDRNNIQSTKSTTKKYTKHEISDDTEGTEPTSNIIQFMKVFSITDVTQRSKIGCKETTPIHKITTNDGTHPKKIKHKKTKSKIHQTIKTKMHKKTKPLEVTKPLKNKTKPSINNNASNMRFIKTIASFKIISKPTTSTQSTTKIKKYTNNLFLKKIKMITTSFFRIKNRTKNAGSIKREHYSISTPQCTTKSTTEKLLNSQSTHIVSELTSEINPNAVIIGDTECSRLNKYKDLLLSIIDFECNKLNKEWMRFANINLEYLETKEHKTTNTLKSTSEKKESKINYDILRDLQGILPPEVNNADITKSMSIILDKIASKFKIKVDNVGSKKAGAEQNSQASKQPSTMKTLSQTVPIGKEADDTTATPRLCNMEVTRQHILKIQRDMPLNEFENYVPNVTCQKYEPAPRVLLLETTKAKDTDKKNIRTWNWIRNRRSLIRSKFNRAEKFNSRARQGTNLEFEVFFKGDHGIYKQILRRKRCVGSEDLLTGLRDLPRLRHSKSEIYAITGDTVKFSCLNRSKPSVKNLTCMETERDGMLNYSNVAVHGDLITIIDVQPKNDGYYFCKEGLTNRKIKLAVLTLPNFIWTSTLLFTKETDCTHNDLKKIKLLGPEMFKKVFQRQSSVTISDPVCLEDRADERNKLGAVVRVNCRRPPVNCSVQCRRDLQAAFATICAENFRALPSIDVMVLEDGVNNTWKPMKHYARLIITRTVRGLINQYDNKRPKEFNPENQHLVISCPAGYRLMSDLKLCTPCPINTYAREGDNACSVCPRGSSSTPGAVRCRRTINRSRRYDWWIYPPCGYGLAAVVGVCCCGVCVVLALIVHVTSRSCGATDKHKAKQQSKLQKKKECRINPGPTRSSRVLMARFFKPSLTSSLATDSQETKFDMWRARNMPPPLPPVDFDS